ncbi:MAG: glycosyltransferase [Prevotella sp.]|nr:glycosyltransferase [Prevotella sp.]
MISISIVTITWNAEHSLQRTLDSVASQTYAGIEHLIVDGASKDGTLAIAERYKAGASYPVVISSEPDRGLYDAMNKGLGRATGDYIVFINAGDTLHATDTLETVVSAINSHPAPINSHPAPITSERPAVVYGDTAITDSDGRFLHLRRLRPPKQLTWRSFRQGMLVCHQAFYARLDIAKQTPYDLTYRHSADVDWCIRIMKGADRLGLPIVNTSNILADFEDGGDTTQHHRDSLRERFDVMRRHYGLFTTMLMHAWFVVRSAIGKGGG